MTKILGQTGVSLADTYNIEGSIAGIEELDSRSVNLVHEMGDTIFAERLSSRIVRVATAATAQNLTFAAVITGFPATAVRILGITLLGTVAELTRAAVMVRFDGALGTAGTEQEMPIWVWDEGTAQTVRFIDNGTLANLNIMLPLANPNWFPNLITGPNQPEVVSQIVVRGLTAGFGAGTTVVTLLAHVLFAGTGGLSSEGVPIPGW